jgi:YhcH/YjgK/YiaL family protein
MIYDKLDNLNIYKNLSADLYEGLKFLQQIDPDITAGVHPINPKVKAIVSEYETKRQNEYGYEAHKKNIDIQFLLKGSEKIACLPIEKLQETKPYSDDNDAAFYTANTTPQEMTIGDDYFAIFFPQDGHMPQLCVDKPMKVKKVVIKVVIE